jgi:hypothetical protein
MIVEGISAVLKALRGRRGMWGFLTRRSEVKADVEKHRVHNEGTQGAIKMLQVDPRGGSLREGGDGWVRELSIPSAPIGRPVDHVTVRIVDGRDERPQPVFPRAVTSAALPEQVEGVRMTLPQPVEGMGSERGEERQ